MCSGVGSVVPHQKRQHQEAAGSAAGSSQTAARTSSEHAEPKQRVVDCLVKGQTIIAASARLISTTAQHDMGSSRGGQKRPRAGQQQQEQHQEQHPQPSMAAVTGRRRVMAAAGSAAVLLKQSWQQLSTEDGVTGAATASGRTATLARRWPRRVMAGTGPVVAHAMYDCTALHRAGDWEALRTRLRLDGYLLLHGVLNAAAVLTAQDFLLHQLRQWRPKAFAVSTSCCKERLADGAAALGLLARQDLAAAAPVAAVLEAPQLFDLMRGLMQQSGQGKMVTSGYKWLRAVAKGEFTGLHCDRVFLGRGSPALLTAWLPLGAVPTERGSLLVARGFHRLRAFDGLRGGYGASEVGSDGTRSGWLADDGRRLQAMTGCAAIDWRTADCAPGDVIVLGLDVLHMSASNTTDLVRLSCDTRWQSACEPRDPRLAVWRNRHGKGA